MQDIVLTAAHWKTSDDFYTAFLAAVGAPDWHGHNLDALWDSVTGADINRVNAPYRVRITGVSQSPQECKRLIDSFVSLFREARRKGTLIEVVCEA